MQRRNVLWTCVAGLFCAGSSFAAQQVSVGGGDMQGVNQEQQCVSRCAEEAKVRITECLQAGGAQRDCLAQGLAFQRECEQQCRSGKTCEERCRKLAARAMRRCLAEGGTEEHCTQLTHEVFENCVREHCPPPPQTCETECERRAIEVLHACIEEGGTQEDCAMRARMFLRHCLDENCPAPAGCRERCEQDAHAVLRICLEMGGTQEDCAERARQHFEQCTAAHCPPPTCEEQCARRALVLYQECVENLGDPTGRVEPGAACAEQAREFYASCVHEHCTDPVSCEERCRRFAAGVKHMCLEMGGSEEDCEARAQEAVGQCLAECPSPCGTIAGIPCEEGEFCLFPPGTCDVSDNAGVCVDIPGGCPDIWQPACGCDGVTYGNRCEAVRAEAQIDHEGPCDRKTCGTIAGIPCEEGEFCLFPPGTCQVSDNAGVCVTLPTACPDVWQPVCGCDGVTYSNRCEAIMAQVQIAQEGPCQPQACGSPDGVPCEEGFFCAFPPGSCGDNTVGGFCREIPDACPTVYMPVCGCDGVTYGNACEAAMHSQSIRHEGPCEDRCGGITGLPCDKGEFCKYPPGTCGCCDLFGVCTPIPLGCPDHVEPVCGCDGVTYFNPCEAAAAGVNISHVGPCEQGCDFNEDCGEHQFCMKRPGDCDAATPGVCAMRPQMCPEFYAPVCGCDGHSYDNPCFAAAAGVSIAHQGTCEN